MLPNPQDSSQWSTHPPDFPDQSVAPPYSSLSANESLSQGLRDRQLRAFFEGALDAMVICDDEGRYLDANPAACQLFGLPRDALLGCRLTEFTQASVFSNTPFPDQAQTRLTGELQIVRADGTVREIEYAATVHFLPHRHLSVMRDVTERKRLEQSLQQLNRELERRVEDRTTQLQQINQRLQTSERRLSFALEAAKAGIWYWDMQTNHTYWSETNYRLMGYEPGTCETTFDLWLQAVHPDDRPWVLAYIQQTLDQRSELQMDYRVQLANGEIRWLRDMGQVLVDDRGHPYAMTGIQIDITVAQTEQLDHHQQALQQQKALLNAIFEGTSDLIAAIDPNFCFLAFNQAYQQTFDKSFGGEIQLGSSLLEAMAHLPEERAHAVAIWERALAGEAFTLVQPFGDPTRQRHTYEVTYSPVRNEQGQLIGAAYILRDISDRIAAEADLRRSQALLEEAQQVGQIGNWSFDVKTQRITWSTQTFRIFGFDPAQPEPTLETHLGLIHPADRQRWQTTVQQSLAEKHGYVIVFNTVQPDGPIRMVEARGEVELDDRGEVVRLFGTVQDITERRQLEDALRSQVQKEQALNRMMQAIRRSLNLSDIFTATVTEIGHLTAAFRSAVVQYLPELGLWRVVADYCRVSDQPSIHGLEFPNEGNQVAAQLNRLEVVQIEDASQIQDAINPTLAEQFGRNWLLVPIALKGNIWGTLALVQEPQRHWQARDRELLQVVADHLAIAIHQAKLYQQVQQELNARQRIEQVLRHTALHDPLTDLPNRTLLMSSLEFALKRIQRQPNYQFAVLFLDLDRFKLVNDSLGHLVGDQLLQAVGKKLANQLRPIDLAARMGGDEFVILLENVASLEAVIATAQALLATLQEPFWVAERKVYITASIGIVLGTAAYSQPLDLLRDADIAMYRAKAKGKNRYALFNPELHQAIIRRLQLDHDLREALMAEQFVLYYQPIVQLQTGEVIGFESLVRWQHPQQGLVPPDEFIPIAEETGLIVPLGQWVLRTACEQIQQWRTAYPALSNLKMHVNLSVEQLYNNNLVDWLQQVLTETGLPGRFLTLELTEGMLINHTENMIARLKELQALELQLTIDDFGTGYSSLSYLHRLPIDALKIDKSFILQMDEDQVNLDIVETIVALADRLGISAVAEGVESADHMYLLQELGCELGQGYYFAKPLPAAEVDAILCQGWIDPA